MIIRTLDAICLEVLGGIFIWVIRVHTKLVKYLC